MVGAKGMACLFAAIAVMAVLGLLNVSSSKPYAESKQEDHQSQHDKAQPLNVENAKQDSNGGVNDRETKSRSNWLPKTLAVVR
jgi:hypothetical protein